VIAARHPDDARRALQALRRAVDQFAGLPPHGAPAALHHQIMAALHGLLACAGEAAEAGVSEPDLYAATARARELCARRSRTLAHAQKWPRGYPGDFELIERLLDAEPDAEGGTLDRALETCVLQLPIVWQHRVKIAWQARLVRRRLNAPGDIRVLSIGCGGARDLLLLEPHELGRLEVVLNDLDPGALSLAEARLSGAVRMLQLLTNWTLIERSEDEMSSLLRAPKLKTSIALDDSGLTWLAVASRLDLPEVSPTREGDPQPGR
jgi:hypothetical protein